MKELIQFENLQVEIWRRSYQRSLNLRVRPDGLVRVTCGRSVPRRAVESFIAESREFILKRQLELELIRQRYPEKQYVSDEEFLFLGERYPLQIVWTWSRRIQMSAVDGRLEMLAPLTSTTAERRKAMHAFFKKIARPHFAKRLAHFAGQMNLQPKSLSVRGQKSRWGSCSARAEISLNWKLLAAPEWVIDYVVVHELAHIRHLNHSPRFWQLVEQHHPGRQMARRWLREHEPALAGQFA